jgi:uncharacterized protein (DUF362 family)
MYRLQSRFKSYFSSLTRRGFLDVVGSLTSVSLFSSIFKLTGFAAEDKKLQPRKKKSVTTEYDLSVVKGDDPAVITRKAIELLGGIGRFVKKGDVVVVKPNIGWDRKPEYAANTNPAVVGTIVRMCNDAGAKVVKVFDNTCNDPRMCYKNSGIQAAVKEAGGYIYHISDWKYFPGAFPEGSRMENWLLFRDAIECDCFINVPVAKHHSLAGLTLSMKNLMGICGGTRGMIHWNLSQKLSELTAFVKPDLTVIDAYRILLRHGPSGGNLKDVEKKRTVVAGTDPVLTDAYAATFFNIDPGSIGHIKQGADDGVGSMDYHKARIKVMAV